MKIAFTMPDVLNRPSLRPLLAIVMTAIALCGATPALAVTVTSSISGIATTEAGIPVVSHSTIELVDFNGTLKQVLTTLPGVYKADTTGLTPPILIKSGNLFGYSETLKGVANVTPLTDLIINQDYQAFGTNAATEFVSPTPRPITQIQLQSAWALDRDVFQQPYAFFKVPATFNPFTTKFSSNSSFGKFLGHTTFGGFGTATQTAQTTLGALDWNATFIGDSSAHWSTSVWQAQLPSSGWSSISGGFTVFPTDPNAGATYNGVGNFFKNTFLPILKHEGKLLDSFNLAPLYAPTGYLNSGRDSFTQSAFDATDFRLLKFKGVNLGVIRDYVANSPDSNHNRITIAVDYLENLNGGSFTKRRYEDFICNTDGSGCSYYGNQQLGGTSSEIKFESDSLSPGLPTTLQSLRVQLFSPQNQFSSVKVSDDFNTYFNMTPMTKSTKVIQLQPVHTLPPIPYTKDDYKLTATLSAPFAYNNEFTYFADSFTYDSYVYGYTNEPVNWMSPDVNGSHLLSDFKLGSPITVKFLPPLSFIPLRAQLEGKACNASQTIDLSSVQKFLMPTAKSASIIVPKQVMGQATTGFELRLRYEGLYGQNSLFKYGVGAPCF